MKDVAAQGTLCSGNPRRPPLSCVTHCAALAFAGATVGSTAKAAVNAETGVKGAWTEEYLLCMLKSFFALHMKNHRTPYKDILFQVYVLGNKSENSFLAYSPSERLWQPEFRPGDGGCGQWGVVTLSFSDVGAATAGAECHNVLLRNVQTCALTAKCILQKMPRAHCESQGNGQLCRRPSLGPPHTSGRKEGTCLQGNELFLARGSTSLTLLQVPLAYFSFLLCFKLLLKFCCYQRRGVNF